ncbi:hypothetical protein JHK82_043814 [Glycine max]|nr:hypothetical protein JHK82_043814 [Glycine max]
MMHTNTARYDLDHFDIIFRPSLHESDRRQKYPFTFDKVFNHEVSQQDVFTEISQLVQSALDGYKVNNTDNQSKSRPVKNDRVIHGDYSRKPPIAEMCSGREQSENRVLGGFPWQINADTNIIGELDSRKPIASWNNFTNSCHGLLQRTLM